MNETTNKQNKKQTKKKAGIKKKNQKQQTIRTFLFVEIGIAIDHTISKTQTKSSFEINDCFMVQSINNYTC
jgi:hypothetical protein